MWGVRALAATAAEEPAPQPPRAARRKAVDEARCRGEAGPVKRLLAVPVLDGDVAELMAGGAAEEDDTHLEEELVAAEQALLSPPETFVDEDMQLVEEWAFD